MISCGEASGDLYAGALAAELRARAPAAEIVGFGGTASYDATLNGKVLDLAIREAVDRLVDGLEADLWQTAPRGNRP